MEHAELGEVPRQGRLSRPPFLEVIMDTNDINMGIIDTPYEDRCCGNCEHCIKTEMRFCLVHHAFIAKNKWCHCWEPQYRYYKFEN